MNFLSANTRSNLSLDQHFDEGETAYSNPPQPLQSQSAAAFSVDTRVAVAVTRGS